MLVTFFSKIARIITSWQSDSYIFSSPITRVNRFIRVTTWNVFRGHTEEEEEALPAVRFFNKRIVSIFVLKAAERRPC